MDPLSIVTSTITLVQATSTAYKAIQHLRGLPNEFNEVNRNLPLAQDTLGLARDQLQAQALDDLSKKALQPLVSGCEEKAKTLQDICDKIERDVKNTKDGSVLDFYRTSLLRLGKANRVETLMQGILRDLDTLATNQLFKTATHSQVAQIKAAIEQLSKVKSSVSDSDLDGLGTNLTQNIATGGTGHQYSGEGHNIVSGPGTMYKAEIMHFGESSQDYKIRRDILKALNTTPYQDRKNRNPDRVPGTCEWFISHGYFKQWRATKSSCMLWVSANPGCGKSVLAKYLVDELKSANSGTTCYFFFKDDFTDQRSANDALNCILHQIFMQREDLFTNQIVRRLESYKLNLACSLDELWDVLVLTSRNVDAGEIVCILDALDECEDQGRRKLSQVLRKFYDTENETKNNIQLKFLVTSRPYERIGRGFQPLNIPQLPVIHLKGESDAETAKIAQEIDVYIVNRVSRIQAHLCLKPDEERLLLQGLRNIPNQTYLWVYLTLELIESDISIDKVKIYNATKSLPRTVNEAYERILAKSSDAKEAKKLLHIIVAAVRPLTVAEMDLVLFLEQKHTCYDDWDHKPEERFSRYLRDLCGLFVNITDSKIYLLHQTAKEFLISKEDINSRSAQDSQLVWESSLQLQKSHRILCQICMWHLLFTEFENNPLDENLDDKISEYVRDYIFIDYSATNWATHFRGSGFKDNAVTDSLERICNTSSGRCRTWFRIYWTSTNTAFPCGFTTLMIASYFGLQQIVQLLLREDGINLDFRDATYLRSALSWASENGFDGVVKLLIKRPKVRFNAITKLKIPKGAEIDSRDIYGRTPLSYAAWNGQMTVVQRLVKAGARVDLVDNIGGTPISYALCTGHEIVAKQLMKGANAESVDNIRRELLLSASEKGNEPVVKRLLDSGAATEVVDSVGRTPLLYATGMGHDAIVKLLLDKGANTNSKDSRYSRTPLIWASGNGYEAIAKLLIEYGADINSMDKTDRSSLSWTAGNGHDVCLKMLLRNGAKVDTKDSGYGRTPLSWAAGNGNENIVKVLLEHGAAVDSKDDNGWTPLWWAVEKGHEKGYETIIKLLIEHGANADSKDSSSRTPLSYAAGNRHQVIVKLLLDQGAVVDSQDTDGRTPLWWAAENQREAMVKLLAEYGANVDFKDNRGRTPLWLAAEKQYEAIVRVLVEHGANVDFKYNDGRTPLSLAAEKQHEAIVRVLVEHGANVDFKDNDGRTPLWLAAEKQHEAIVRVLIEHGANIDSKDSYGCAPLLWAVRNGHATFANFLLEQGADVDSQDRVTRTPLSWAAEKGYEEIVKVLISNGANINGCSRSALSWIIEQGHEAIVSELAGQGTVFTVKDRSYNITPLILAIENGHEAIVKLLIQHRADINLRDKYDQTPLLYATKNGHEGFVKLLVEHGADVDARDSRYSQTPLWWAVKKGFEEIAKVLVEHGADVESKDTRYGQTPLSWAQNRNRAMMDILHRNA